MDKQDILIEIEQQFSSLTKTQRKVADYILQHPMQAVFLTVDQLAQASETSTATIVRFASAFGYSGYGDFQHDLQQSMQKRMAPSHRLEERFQYLESRSDIFSDIFMILMDGLQETFDNLDEKALMEAVKLIAQGHYTYVTGSRSCHSAAHYLSYNLLRITGQCSFLDPTCSWFAEDINRIAAGDIFICFSLPRYITQVCEAARIAKERGAHVIAVTDSLRSALAEHCDVLLRVAYKTYDFHNSVMPAMLIAELIISLVTVESPLATKKNLSQVERILDSLNVHINQ